MFRSVRALFVILVIVAGSYYAMYTLFFRNLGIPLEGALALNSVVWLGVTLCLMAIAGLSLNLVNRQDKLVKTDWVIAWRRNFVVFDPDSQELRFRAWSINETYRRSATAKCHGGPLTGWRHFGLKWHRCGFYSYRNDEQALKAAESCDQLALVRVALRGKVKPYTLGFRSTQQVITDIWFDRVCVSCKQHDLQRPADHLVIDPKHSKKSEISTVRPYCEYHLPLCGDAMVFTTWDLGYQLRVNVRWREVIEPIPDTVAGFGWQEAGA